MTFAIVLILGLVIGSFLTCISYRLPKNISFLSGRSECPKCKKKIKAYDNIPLLSFILLRGRCRKCKVKISPRYPLIEVGTAILFGVFYLLYANCSTTDYYFCSFSRGVGIIGLAFILIAVVLVSVIFITDLETQIIPDEIVFFGFGLSVLFFLVTNNNFFERLLSAFAVSTVLLVLHLITRGRGMGLGDVKFALFGGMFFTLVHGLIWIMLSFLVGGAFGAILLALGKTKFGARIAFGPFMVIAFVVMLIFGEYITFGFL